MEDKCSCGNEAEKPHRCPYIDDVHNQFELEDNQVSLCNCCKNCTVECANDI